MHSLNHLIVEQYIQERIAEADSEREARYAAHSTSKREQPRGAATTSASARIASAATRAAGVIASKVRTSR